MITCANCGDDAPPETPPVPRGHVWLCDPCESEVDIALET